MIEHSEKLRSERVAPEVLYPELKRVVVFEELTQENLVCLGPLEVVRAQPGAEVMSPTSSRAFWALLEGEVRVVRKEADGSVAKLVVFTDGESFGEMPILMGSDPGGTVEAMRESRLVRFDEEAFWQLMFSCPRVRSAVMGNMARRLEAYQAFSLQREKLASLGTMAAGLMHELNNPASAALRAASQMRENLRRLQEISLRKSREPMNAAQMECVIELQEKALRADCCRTLSTLEQADREDTLANWLDKAGVANGWRLAPVLASMEMDPVTLACARDAFTGTQLSDMLNWLEALISSAQLVGTIEESIARVTDLVMAVKRFSYSGKNGCQALDVHESLRSAMVILLHKLKSKGIQLRKEFGSALPLIEDAGVGLSQVWINLLDNAIDASPEGGTITVRTWADDQRILVAIADQGPGIAPADQKRIFEPFYTTKAPGSGTGLGLEIVRRIVVTQMEGEIRLESAPGATEFVVELPLHRTCTVPV
jgi:signal transduction histidine kinase